MRHDVLVALAGRLVPRVAILAATMLNPDGHEISDLIVDYDPVSLERRRVRRDEVVATLRAQGMRWGAWVAAGLPERDGWLDEVEVDALLVRVHAEMQRLWEEFLQGERVRALLVPLLAALREHGHRGPVRVVDVGCGLGYLVRWLAARGRLGDDVELIGCDYNRALIDAARHHAAAEGLRCSFHVANAFTLEEPATVFLSTGVLHHFRGPGLERFSGSFSSSSTTARPNTPGPRSCSRPSAS